mgnify:FL=1
MSVKRDFDKFYSEYIQMHEGDIFALTNGALKYAMKKCGLNKKIKKGYEN